MSLPDRLRLRSMGLRARMGLVAGVAVALAVLAVSVSAYVGTSSAVMGQIDNSLNNLDAQILHTRAGGGGDERSGAGGGDNTTVGNPAGVAGPGNHGAASLNGFSGLGRDCDQGLGINVPGRPFGGPQVFVQLLRRSGSICRSTGETATIPVTRRAEQLADTGHGRYYANQTVNGSEIRVLVHGIPGIGALMMAQPLGAADGTLDNELLLLGIIAAAGIGLAALLGFLVARAAVAPITRFTSRTERIAHDVNRLERERLEIAGNDELSRLAITFNQTLDSLEASIDAQRNLVADASHELRTPIATLRANLQLLREESRLPPEEREALRRDMIEELDELTNLVSDVVELARGTKASDEPGDVRLGEIVEEAVERARRRGPQLEFRTELEPTLIRGEAERIGRAVNNLLDNAIKWAPAGSAVEVSLAGGVLRVRDHGPGFHDEDLPSVFDRFHRAADARSKPGSGLGLAIVRQTAESHGGHVRAANAPGGGALMEISFGPVLATEEGEGEEPEALSGAQGVGRTAGSSSG